MRGCMLAPIISHPADVAIVQAGLQTGERRLYAESARSLRLREPAIALTNDGLQRIGGRPQFATQALNMDVHSAGPRPLRILPDRAQQSFAADAPACILS